MSRLAAALALLVTLFAAPRAGATWSIILFDIETGEVAIGSATCLTTFDLNRGLPVVVVERGAAAAQSAIDVGGTNRKKIWDELFLGTPADEIIEIAKQGDFFKATRQYGVVEAGPTAAGFTGPSVFGYKEDRQGSFDNIVYAIQGNVLAGIEVMDAMELALLGSTGSLGDRLVAGMEAARLAGGDGRCWCSEANPASCDPATFDPDVDKSAHIGFLIVARPGDEDGVCTGGLGCANGDYHLALNVAFQQVEDVDPVVQLHAQYDAFVASQAGRPDGIESTVTVEQPVVLAGSGDARSVSVDVRDIDGAPVDLSGMTVTAQHAADSAGLSSIGSITVVGSTIDIALTGGDGLGVDVFDVLIDDGIDVETIAPRPRLEHTSALVAGPSVSASLGGTVNFALRGPDDIAGTPYAMWLSASGTDPGVVIASGAVVPLNFDRLLLASNTLATLGVLTGAPAFLGDDATARAGLRVPAGAFPLLTGLKLWGAWFTIGPDPFVSNAAAFEIRP